MFMVRTMYFPTVIAGLWEAIFLLTFLCYEGKWCTLVRLMAANPERCISYHGSFAYR